MNEDNLQSLAESMLSMLEDLSSGFDWGELIWTMPEIKARAAALGVT